MTSHQRPVGPDVEIKVAKVFPKVAQNEARVVFTKELCYSF